MRDVLRPGIRACAAVLLVLCAGALSGAVTQGANPVPVGARYRPPPDEEARNRDLQEMQRRRFTVVLVAPMQGQDRAPDRLLRLDPFARGIDEAFETGRGAPGIVAVGDRSFTAADVTLHAWAALARGAPGVLFDDWAALQRDAGLLAAATAFAEEMMRNAALYGPLRPYSSQSDMRRVRVAGATGRFEAQVLESAEALLLVAMNFESRSQRATLTFSPDLPEAIWQDMLTGASVNFVASGEGPTYTRTFPGKDVLVLMIRKSLR